MKAIFAKILSWIKAFRITWVVITIAFAFLLHINFLGFLGAIAMTVLFIVFNSKIHAISIHL